MKYKLNILVFLAALAVLFIFVIVLPADPDAPDFENRSMAEKPSFSVKSFLDGSFFNNIEDYLSDAAAYRTSLLHVAADMEQSYGMRISGSAILVDISAADLGLGLIPDEDDEDLYFDMQEPADTSGLETAGATQVLPIEERPGSAGDTAGDPEVSPGDTDAEQTREPDEADRQTDPAPSDIAAGPTDVATGPSDPAEAPVRVTSVRVDPSGPFSIDVDYHEDAILYERYREGARAARRYAEILNSYMSRVPDNVRVFSMLAPIRVEFMGESYASSNDSQRETIDKINGLLDERIIRTATYERLAAHVGEYIHFRTDHHWTALGAYYAYLSFAEAAGLAPIDISNYIEHSIPGFLGSFGKGSRNRTVRDHPDTLYYYTLDNGTTFSRRLFVIPDDLSRLSYRVFLGGDYSKLDFTSSNQNGRTLVVVKDSYANALIPWLAPHYERIIVIDSRQYTGSVTRLLGELEDADLLFMNYVAATAMSDFIETIYSVR